MNEEKDSYGFDFNDKYEEIIAAMQKRQEEEYDDIVSDSSLEKAVDRKGSHSGGRYKKKSRGKFKTWWKNLKKGKKAKLISVTAVVLVIAILLGWFFIYFRYNYNSITGDPETLGFSDIIDKNVVNVALFGVDSRDETVFKGNTDSIMILSLNTKTKKVKIISVMRDTFVPMEYEGEKYYGKINSAYVKGPEHAIKTLNQIFDLDISEYATVNFFGMVDIIDAVGGITATITEDELKWKGTDHPNLNNCMDEICAQMGLDAKDYYIKEAGEHQLNGVQAVAYSRVRNCTSTWGTRDDFGRTDRQRHVMEQLFNKAVTMKKTQYTKLAKALIPCTETSLSYSDIISLAFNILLSSPAFEQYRLPPAEYQSDFLMKGPSGYGSIIYYDLDYAAKLIHAVIYDDMTMEQYIEENGIEHNDWYSKRNSGTTYPSKPSGNTSQSTTSSATVSENNTTDTESTASSVSEQTPTVSTPEKEPDTSSKDTTSSKPDNDNTQSSDEQPGSDKDTDADIDTDADNTDKKPDNTEQTPDNNGDNTGENDDTVE